MRLSTEYGRGMARVAQGPDFVRYRWLVISTKDTRILRSRIGLIHDPAGMNLTNSNNQANMSNNSKIKRTRRNRTKGGSVARIVDSILLSKAEHKYLVNTHASATTSSAAGFIHTITQSIAGGDEVNQRDGRQITHLQTDLRFSVNLPSAAISGVFRVIWFVDKLNTGSVPSVTDVLETASVTSGYTYEAVVNKRYTIIHDKAYSMVVASTSQHITPVLFYKRQYPVMYSGFTNAAASNGAGAQFCLIITDLGANQPLYTMEAHTRFLDM